MKFNRIRSSAHPAPFACVGAAFVFAVGPLRGQTGAWEQTHGPVGGSIAALAVDGSTLYATNVELVFRSDDGGVNWITGGAGLPVDPRLMTLGASGDEVYAGSRIRGVWRSADRGATWMPTGAQIHPGCFDIEIDGGRVYALASQQAGFGSFNSGDLFVSDDHGMAWTLIATPEPLTCLVVEAGTLWGGSFFGVQRSLDAGKTWTFFPMGSGFPLVSKLIKAGGALLAHAASDQNLHRSLDGGQTWLPASQGLPSQVFAGALAGGPSYLLAALQTGGTHKLFRSMDAGASWQPAGAGLPTGSIEGFTTALAVVGPVAFVGNPVGVHRSTDQAASFVFSAQGPVATAINDVASSGGTLLAAARNFARVHRSTDAGATWAAGPALAGTPNMQVKSLRDLGAPGVLAGTHDAGVFRSTDGGQTWSPANTGLPTYIGIAGTQFREMDHLAANGPTLLIGTGTSLEHLNTQPGGQGPEISGGGVWRSTDGGQSWHLASSGLPSLGVNLFNQPIFQPILGLAGFGDMILAGVWLNGPFRSLNNGDTWSPVMSGLEACGVGGIVGGSGFVQVPGGDILASFVCPLGPVWRLPTGGSAWQLSSSGLPPSTAAGLLVHAGVPYVSMFPSSPLATDGGVYRSTDGGFTWQRTGGEELARRFPGPLAGEGDHLYAGVFGAGVWRLDGACYPDCNADGALTVADFGCFQTKFVAGDPYADCNAVGGLTVADFGCFQTKFVAGCP